MDTAAAPGGITPGPAAGARIVTAVVIRPWLWRIALRQAWRLRRRSWWKHRPFLPVPDADYLHFRMVTAYGGDGSRAPHPQDLVTYLEWLRAWELRT